MIPLLYSFLFLEEALGQLCPLSPLPWVTCSGEHHIPRAVEPWSQAPAF